MQISYPDQHPLSSPAQNDQTVSDDHDHHGRKLQEAATKTSQTEQDHLTITILSRNSPSSSPDPLLVKEPASPWGSRTTIQPISTEETPPGGSILNPPLHPVFQTITDQELGRHVLAIVIPVVVFLLSNNKLWDRSADVTGPITFLCVGFMLVWNGILLRKVFHYMSMAMEIVGIAVIFLAFYVTVALFLPAYELWIPLLCWVLTLFPYVVAIIHRKEGVNAKPDCAPERSSVLPV